MKKRIFIVIKLSKELQDKIAVWQKSHNDLKVRWLKPQNWHITLAPPWQEKDIEKIKEKMELLKKELASFTVTFTEITVGPNLRHPRLIWLEGESKEFENLKKKLEKYFGNPDPHKPKPHITIARFKNLDYFKLPNKELAEKIDWQEEIKNLVLFESLGNSEYKALYDITL
jgi:2'-5' RNA ligase